MIRNSLQYEKQLLNLLEKKLDYKVYDGNKAKGSIKPFFEPELKKSLARINVGLPAAAIEEAIIRLSVFDTVNVIQINEAVTEYLQNGIELSYKYRDRLCNCIVQLVDYKVIDNNSFSLMRHWQSAECEGEVLAAVIYLNGLPIAIFCDSEEDMPRLQNNLPYMFYYNCFFVAGSFQQAKILTITAERFYPLQDDFFEKRTVLDYIKHFTFFKHDAEAKTKLIACPHQYTAVKKAVKKTLGAVGNGGKAGIFWHTQGSGKSVSMIFYAKFIHQYLKQATIIVLTDRNDLDNQLFSFFYKCHLFLRQKPMQAESRKDLKNLISGREANGLIFTTIQKFIESQRMISAREDIVIIVDEAHRSQYNLEEGGYAHLVRSSFPNATYIAFTGTPVLNKERSTVELFGEYIDIYDMAQAVRDKATVPVYCESRGRFISSDDEALDFFCEDFLRHYEDRAYILAGKALVAVESRETAIKLYLMILNKRADYRDRIKVVMTIGHKDPKEWREIVAGRNGIQETEKEFRDEKSSLKLVIVVDMWLTGFDMPALNTLYIMKQMDGHNLIQAMTRTNRLCPGKTGGLVVDYVTGMDKIKETLGDYTKSGWCWEADVSLDVCRDFIKELRGLARQYPSEGRMLLDICENILKTENSAEKFFEKMTLLGRNAVLGRGLFSDEIKKEFAVYEAVWYLISFIKNQNLPQISREAEKMLEAAEIKSFISGAKAPAGARLQNLNRINLSCAMIVYSLRSAKANESILRKLDTLISECDQGVIKKTEALEKLIELEDEIEGLSNSGKSVKEASIRAILEEAGSCANMGELSKDLWANLENLITLDWHHKESSRAKLRRVSRRILNEHQYEFDMESEVLDKIFLQCRAFGRKDNGD